MTFVPFRRIPGVKPTRYVARYQGHDFLIRQVRQFSSIVGYDLLVDGVVVKRAGTLVEAMSNADVQAGAFS